MTSQSFIIAALAVGCLLLQGSEATPAPPAASSLNISDIVYQRILVEAQGGNVTLLTSIIDHLLGGVVSTLELAEDDLEHNLEGAVEKYTLLAEAKLLDIQGALLNRNTTVTLDEVKAAVAQHVEPAHQQFKTAITALKDIQAASLKI